MKVLEGWTKEETERFQKLTKREKQYYRQMKPKSGVLMLSSKPGVAKSAMLLNISDVMEHHYEDMRLSQCDETDFKFPFLEKGEYAGETITVSGTAIPRWAYEANQRPTIIHFEELNRAPQFVRNAALGILLERQIGGFKFNDNVLMVASGNLGEEDGTDVEEFDAALKNRLITFNHSLPVDDWLDNFAKDKVHSSIVSFIKNYPEYLYVDPTEDTSSYATPRSWTFLSDYIIMNYGKDASSQDFINDISSIGQGYVGVTFNKFLRFCQEQVKLNIDDIITNFPKVKKQLQKFGRDKYSELLTSLKERDINKLTEKEIRNVQGFLDVLDPDELTGYLLNLVDTVDTDTEKICILFDKYHHVFENIDNINDDN